MVVVDDEGNPTTSINGNKRLVYLENAIVVIGAVHSSCTLANMEVTKEAGVPQITPISTSPEITQKGNKWIFRTAATDAIQAENIVKIALEKLKKKRLAVIYVLDDYGRDATKVLLDVSNRMGYPPVAVESFNPDDKDFSSQLLKIKEKNADTLIIWSLYEPAALIAKQVAQMGFEVQLMGGGGLTNSKYVELGGAATNGTIMCQTYHPSSKESHIVSFTEKFKKKYGRDPDPNAAQSYDAIMIVAEALEKVGVDDKSKLRDAIASILNFNGVTGIISFDDTGDAPREMKVIQIRNGNYELF
jgi:branched-chain amino acid transport system substrate-binding protein